jgi:hypothetical protein
VGEKLLAAAQQAICAVFVSSRRIRLKRVQPRTRVGLSVNLPFCGRMLTEFVLIVTGANAERAVNFLDAPNTTTVCEPMLRIAFISIAKAIEARHPDRII